MWFLQFHLVFCLICFLLFVLLLTIFQKRMIKNGYGNARITLENAWVLFLFLIPVLNVMMVVVAIIMAVEDSRELHNW